MISSIIIGLLTSIVMSYIVIWAQNSNKIRRSGLELRNIIYHMESVFERRDRLVYFPSLTENVQIIDVDPMLVSFETLYSKIEAIRDVFWTYGSEIFTPQYYNAIAGEKDKEGLKHIDNMQQFCQAYPNSMKEDGLFACATVTFNFIRHAHKEHSKYVTQIMKYKEWANKRNNLKMHGKSDEEIFREIGYVDIRHTNEEIDKFYKALNQHRLFVEKKLKYHNFDKWQFFKV